MAPAVLAFKHRLEAAWSSRTATTWSPDNPALGQCSVTALVTQDQFGGTICKTRVGDALHFYNWIDGQRLDLTQSQFSAPIAYDDLPATREDAMADTSQAQYEALLQALHA